MTVFQAYLKNSKTQAVLTKKPGEEGFSLIELVVVVAVLAILAAIAIPSFTSINNKARGAAAANTVATIAKECAVKYANGEQTPTFAPVKPDGYNSITIGTSTTNCAQTGLITATSTATTLYPTFIYNIGTGVKTCSGGSAATGCDGGAW